MKIERKLRQASQTTIDSALGGADLRRDDASAVAGGRAPVRQRVGEVFHYRCDFRRSRILYWRGDFAQFWIAQLQDRLNGHEFPPVAAAQRVRQAFGW